MEAEKEVAAEQPPTNENEKHYKKGQPRQKRPRVQRKNEYEYNAELITIDTEIPPLPKKNEIIPKPDIKVYKQKELKLNAKITQILQKKKDIRAEKFQFNRKNKGEGENPYSAFKDEISEVQQIRERFTQVRNERNTLWDKFKKAIQEAKANNERIKEYRTALKGSRQNFSQKLQEQQHRLLGATLSKDEEKNLNNEIMLLKRKIREAESSGNIEFKLESCEQRKDQLDQEIDEIKKEKEPLEIQYNKLKEELDKKNQHITGLKGQIENDKGLKTEEKGRHDKQYENWKEDKKKRLDKLEADFIKIKEDTKAIWDTYHQKQDQYWKQKQYIDFIEWQNKVKSRRVNEKERQARKAEYEKRDKEREKEDQLKQYINQIELINFLITYLNNLRSESGKTEEKKEVKINPAELSAKMSSDSQWKKEKGLEVIQSKKSKEDEQPEKKHKKKKKEVTKQEQKFSIPFSVQTMFQGLRLLAPTKPEEIDEKIKELKEREQLFIRASKEESNQQDKTLANEIKSKQTKKQTVHKVAKKNQEDDFPSI